MIPAKLLTDDSQRADPVADVRKAIHVDRSGSHVIAAQEAAGEVCPC
jgi:hypothetical protein